VQWSATYQPFGNTSTGVSGIVQNLRLPGQEWDLESTFNHNGFRDYAATLTRYIQTDPIGLAGGMNTYQYAGGNPFKYVDPSGTEQYPFQNSVPAGYATSPPQYSVPVQNLPAASLQQWWDKTNKSLVACDVVVAKPCNFVFKLPGPFLDKLGLWGVCQGTAAYACEVEFGKQSEKEPERGCPTSYTDQPLKTNTP
jgi:RHS repeat-associated protein